MYVLGENYLKCVNVLEREGEGGGSGMMIGRANKRD
jgi:hypothetical protein